VAADHVEPEEWMSLKTDLETVHEVQFEPLGRGEHHMHAQLPAGYRVNEVSESCIMVFNLTNGGWVPGTGFRFSGPKLTRRLQ
jgi:hypothetical protein